MPASSTAIGRIVLSGTYVGLCMSTAIGLIGKVTIRTAVVPLNAISHIFWGTKAGQKNRWSMRYTASGLLLNQLACMFGAACYEYLLGRR